MKVHSGDMVQVISGKDKGKKGKILAAKPESRLIVVEGVNIATRHIKKQWTTPGQIVKIEKPIHASCVMVLDPDSSKPTRIGMKIEWGKKVRFAKKSEKVI